MSAVQFVLRDLDEQKARDTAAILRLDGAPEAAVAHAARDVALGRRIRSLTAAGVLSIDAGGICRIDRARLTFIQRRRAIRLFAASTIAALAVLAPIVLALVASTRSAHGR